MLLHSCLPEGLTQYNTDSRDWLAQEPTHGVVKHLHAWKWPRLPSRTYSVPNLG
jgi:hypothetical protein